MLQKLRQLEEEEPQLHILWDSQFSEIHAQLMGEVQIEILKKLIWDRFHVAVEFGAGSIVYKETVAEPVEGVGHFEPLRHYAEVHLLIEPGEPGSGCQFFTACSEDVLARNWQRLILTHLEEKEHIGVLTGSPLTDVQITILTGRAHAKHTEGGDFRQATYRAVRQGLRKARNILLEPYYEFRLEVPAEMIGRAMADVQKMQGTFDAPEVEGETAILKGTAAVAQMRDYQKEVVSYTHGTGKLFCSLKGYAPCKNQDEVVQNIGYDPEADLENPTGLYFARMVLALLFPGIRWKLICICKVVWIWMNWTVKAGMRIWKVRKIRVQRWITQTFPEISVEKMESFLTAEAMKKRKNCRLFLNVLLGR